MYEWVVRRDFRAVSGGGSSHLALFASLELSSVGKKKETKSTNFNIGFPYRFGLRFGLRAKPSIGGGPDRYKVCGNNRGRSTSPVSGCFRDLMSLQVGCVGSIGEAHNATHKHHNRQHQDWKRSYRSLFVGAYILTKAVLLHRSPTLDIVLNLVVPEGCLDSPNNQMHVSC